MLDLIVSLAEQLHIDVFELGTLVLFTVFFGVGTLTLSAARKTEIYQRYAALLGLLDDVLWAAILAVEGESIDLTVYEQRADEREAEGLIRLDPRMLYVLDIADNWTKRQGLDIDFEEMLTRAEGMYQAIELKLITLA